MEKEFLLNLIYDNLTESLPNEYAMSVAENIVDEVAKEVSETEDPNLFELDTAIGRVLVKITDRMNKDKTESEINHTESEIEDIIYECGSIAECTDNIPFECVKHIIGTVKDFETRYKNCIDSIEGWGTPLNREDPEFFKELLTAANNWMKTNDTGYLATPKDIMEVFDPHTY